MVTSKKSTPPFVVTFHLATSRRQERQGSTGDETAIHLHTWFIAPLQPIVHWFSWWVRNHGAFAWTFSIPVDPSLHNGTRRHCFVRGMDRSSGVVKLLHGRFSGPKGQQHISPGQRRCAALEASPPPRVQEPHWSQALKERHKNPHAEVVSLLQSSGIYYLVYPGRRFVRLAPDSALPRAGLFLARWAAPHAAVAARQYATARRPCQQGVISRNGST